MAIDHGYATLEHIKAQLDINQGDLKDDELLERAIEAASRSIDDLCGRRFYEATETRTYTAESMLYLAVDDLVSVATLSTDEDGDRVWETVWAATDFDLGPANASLDGAPFTCVEPSPAGRYLFPTHARAVQINGSFGRASVPMPVVQACLLMAARVWKRKDTPLGIQVGKPEFGNPSIPGKDPDVERLLMPYRKFHLLGV